MEESIYLQFKKALNSHKNDEGLATYQNGEYKPITYSEIDKRVRVLASELSKLLNQDERVALLLPNSPEWVMVDLACASQGLIVVPIHTTYNETYIRHIIDHCGARCLVTTGEQFKKIAGSLEGSTLEHIIFVGSYDGSEMRQKIHMLDDMFKGRTVDSELSVLGHDIQSNDEHTIVYTSGTTGKPKGVMLTHKNLISNALAACRRIPIKTSDRFFSFLPLSHIFERTAGYYAPLFSGASIYYARDVSTLMDDLKLARPTVLICVPRIFERAHERIIEKFSHNPVIHKLFQRAMAASAKMQRKEQLSVNEKVLLKIADALLFKKVRARFGGRVRFAVSGGASLSAHLGQFFQSVGIPVIEGYGLTETSPILTANSLEEVKFGAVGKPLDTVELKIAADGEILARGEGIMKGYYNDPELTSDVIDKDRWFHTGDMGTIDANGFLTITGRIKEMIVLSTGRNVFPVPIEQQLEESKYIAQAMVYGDGKKALSAFIVLDLENLKAAGIDASDANEKGGLNKVTPFHEIIREEVNKHIREIIR